MTNVAATSPSRRAIGCPIQPSTASAGPADEDPVNGVDDDGDSLIDEDPPEVGDGDPDCEEQLRNIIVHQP